MIFKALNKSQKFALLNANVLFFVTPCENDELPTLVYGAKVVRFIETSSGYCVEKRMLGSTLFPFPPY